MLKKGLVAGMEAQIWFGVSQKRSSDELEKKGTGKGKTYDSDVKLDGTGNPYGMGSPDLVVARGYTVCIVCANNTCGAGDEPSAE